MAVAPSASGAPPGADDLLEIRLRVLPGHDGWRLDRFLCDRIPRLSRARVQRIVRNQGRLGGRWRRPAMRVREGDEVVILRPAPDEPEVPRTFDVLHEDAAILAIAKPAGLPVHPTARYVRNTLTAILAERHGAAAPRLAHRLDRETSGVMLLARTAAAERALKAAFARRAVSKTYLAIVAGDPGPAGTIDAPIGPDRESGIRVRQAVNADGLPARTRYRRLARRGGFSLVEAAPETGRQHQIRVHLAHLGTPIVGDKLYGPDPSLMIAYADGGWTPELAGRLLLPRHALHAAAIAFPHPQGGAMTTIRCPLPGDLADFWDDPGARASGEPDIER